MRRIGVERMRTKRIYETDGRVFSFDAAVADCIAAPGGYALALDQTAFFPGGGGQAADEGTINGEPVAEVYERQGVVWHVLPTAYPVGAAVHGEVSEALRFRRMQQHSGEHLLSGVAHSLYGCENVGFHMGETYVTVDFDRPLTAEQIADAEKKANEAVYANVPVRCVFPSAEELAAMAYRSKLELTENVRIVLIEGYDACACCAPHVSRTGEIGLIKVLSYMNYKGGVRLTVKSGGDALADYAAKCAQTGELIAMLCAKEESIPESVRALQEEAARLRLALAQAQRRQVQALVATVEPTAGNAAVFGDELSADALRFAVNEGVAKVGGVFAAFTPAETGYRYCMGSQSVNLSGFAGTLHAALGGRGGGKPNMIQGSVPADRESIEDFLKDNR